MSLPGAAPDLTKLDLPRVPPRYKFTTEFLFNFTMRLHPEQPPMVLGEAGKGFMMVISEQGTQISGPKINGCVAAYGQDYVTIRQDGVGEHIVRPVMLTDDGCSDWGGDGYAKAAAGEMPSGSRIRYAPYIQTSHKDYLWVNRLQCIEIYPEEGYACFDVYSLI
ncbi:LOW QUALITY PROTEIN: hypothetical protein J3E72DRAFT_398293 [Bipolaris maydis]|nr:LOW QUALITY PROTEIN: hypothetical protein J3E72DRAFT_398293 [Bipolaris maydis]